MNKDHKHHAVPQKCPACSLESDVLRSVTISEKSTQSIFHVTCGNCQHAFLFFSVQGEMGNVSLGMITDLSQEESEKFLYEPPITHQDAFALYTAGKI